MAELPDYAFYRGDSFIGSKIPEAEFPLYRLRAFDALNLATQGRLESATLEGDDLTKAKKAICCQADYYYEHGLQVGSQASAGESWTVGKVSVSESSGGNWWERQGSRLCPYAVAWLEMLGLLVRRVDVCP